jgi:hypothetical protein
MFRCRRWPLAPAPVHVRRYLQARTDRRRQPQPVLVSRIEPCVLQPGRPAMCRPRYSIAECQGVNHLDRDRATNWPESGAFALGTTTCFNVERSQRLLRDIPRLCCHGFVSLFEIIAFPERSKTVRTEIPVRCRSQSCTTTEPNRCSAGERHPSRGKQSVRNTRGSYARVLRPVSAR